MNDRLNFPSSPLNNVFVEDGYESRRDGAGRVTHVSYADPLGLARAVRKAILHKPFRLTGPEIAYLRKRLDLFQKELAEMIGTSEQSLHLWESERGTIPAMADAAIRTIFQQTESPSSLMKREHVTFDKFVVLARPGPRDVRYIGTRVYDKWEIRMEMPDIRYTLKTSRRHGALMDFEMIRQHYIVEMSPKVRTTKPVARPVHRELHVAVVKNETVFREHSSDSHSYNEFIRHVGPNVYTRNPEQSIH